MHHAPRTTHHAFSLVELSIVLVILGLLVGGVLAGKSLIRAAELRKIVAEHKNFVTAVLSFRDKYFALPGDMTNATQFWGSGGAGIFCQITVSGTRWRVGATCNGDGDGLLARAAYNGSGVLTGYSYQVTGATGQITLERAAFWQHLANAGLIQPFPISDSYLLQTSSAAWEANDFSKNRVGFLGYFNGDYGLGFRVINRNSDSVVETALASPPELYNIDTKIDDGKPATGKMLVHTIVPPTNMDACTDTADLSNLNANYLLSSNVVGCNIIFRKQF